MQKESQKLEWLEFDLFEECPSIIHGVFLRHGGASVGPFSSLNLCDSVADHPDAVKENREIVRKALGLKQLVFAKQLHGAEIVEVTKQNLRKNFECDALFTREKGIGLAILHADCQAALLYDRKLEIVAALHVGWRGLVANLYGKTIGFFRDTLHSTIEDLVVCIAPSLGPDHAEFIHYKKEFPPEFWSFQPKPNHFDLWEIAHKQLLAAGLHDKQIEISRECTFCNKEDYYSYRRDNETGRHATVIALK